MRLCFARFVLLVLLAAPGVARANAPSAAAPTGGEPGQLCRAAIAAVERESGLPPRLLAAMARVETGRRDPDTGRVHPWPWTINAEGRGSFFHTKAAAFAAVQALQAQGVRSIDVGCMQINLRHHPNAFAGLDEAFDPAANARYAARFLKDLHATRGDWMRSASHYHSQTPELAEAYRARVAAAMDAEQAVPAPTVSAPAMLATAPAPRRRAGAALGGAAGLCRRGRRVHAVQPHGARGHAAGPGERGRRRSRVGRLPERADTGRRARAGAGCAPGRRPRVGVGGVRLVAVSLSASARST